MKLSSFMREAKECGPYHLEGPYIRNAEGYCPVAAVQIRKSPSLKAPPTVANSLVEDYAQRMDLEFYPEILAAADGDFLDIRDVRLLRAEMEAWCRQD